MNTKLKKIAGQQLQLLRLEKNLTQEQMSEKLNLSTSAYCKIEYGETDLTLTRLDKISGITSKNGINDAKRLNIRVVTVSNDDKPKNRKTQRKADLRRRMVCKSLPVKE